MRVVIAFTADELMQDVRGRKQQRRGFRRALDLAVVERVEQIFRAMRELAHRAIADHAGRALQRVHAAPQFLQRRTIVGRGLQHRERARDGLQVILRLDHEHVHQLGRHLVVERHVDVGRRLVVFVRRCGCARRVVVGEVRVHPQVVEPARARVGGEAIDLRADLADHLLQMTRVVATELSALDDNLLERGFHGGGAIADGRKADERRGAADGVHEAIRVFETGGIRRALSRHLERLEDLGQIAHRFRDEGGRYAWIDRSVHRLRHAPASTMLTRSLPSCFPRRAHHQHRARSS